MSDHRLWAEQLQPLTNDVRVVVPDLRGHGRTGGSETAEEIKRSHAEPFPETPPEEAEKIRSALVSSPDIDVDHGAITVPSLLLYGEREPPSMARHARYMAETIPTADARPIPDAGHNSHVDAPAFVVETLREFLSPSTNKLSINS